MECCEGPNEKMAIPAGRVADVPFFHPHDEMTDLNQRTRKVWFLNNQMI